MASDRVINELKQDLHRIEEEVQDLEKVLAEKRNRWSVLKQVIALYANEPSHKTTRDLLFNELLMPSKQFVPRGEKEAVVLQLLKEVGTPMKSITIHNKLSEMGREINKNTFDALMSKMWHDGKVTKPKYGHYQYNPV